MSAIAQQMNSTNGSEVNSHKYSKSQQHSLNISPEKLKQYADRYWPYKEVCIFYDEISLVGSFNVSFAPIDFRKQN